MRLLFLSGLAVCAFWTLALKAELLILGGGHVLKATEVTVEDDSVHVSLPSGGSMNLPLMRVEAILDDEIVPENEAPPPSPAPPFEIRFKESQPVPEAPFGQLIHSTARRHRLNPSLVAAIVRWESGFDPDALSPRGARGLLQLMPATAARFGVGVEELTDPVRNLDAGARYLAWLADQFEDDLPRVLAAFNSGEGTVLRYQGVPPYRETREFVRRVYRELGIGGEV